MKVLPKIEIKQFEECQPGELVRFLGWGHKCLGIVAKDPALEHDFYVTLTDDEVVPSYWPLDRKPDAVLSYGLGYYFEVDHTQDFDLERRELSISNGAMLRWPDRWTMLVAPASGMGRHIRVHYDLESGTIVEDQRTLSVAAFAKWELHLQLDDATKHRPEPLVRYTVKKD